MLSCEHMLEERIHSLQEPVNCIATASGGKTHQMEPHGALKTTCLRAGDSGMPGEATGGDGTGVRPAG